MLKNELHKAFLNRIVTTICSKKKEVINSTIFLLYWLPHNFRVGEPILMINFLFESWCFLCDLILIWFGSWSRFFFICDYFSSRWLFVVLGIPSSHYINSHYWWQLGYFLIILPEEFFFHSKQNTKWWSGSKKRFCVRIRHSYWQKTIHDAQGYALVCRLSR